MMWGYTDWSWVWMVGMMGTMLLFWGGVIALVIFGIRAFASPRSTGDQAVETLRRRLAAGEISQEDYERTRRTLQGMG